VVYFVSADEFGKLNNLNKLLMNDNKLEYLPRTLHHLNVTSTHSYIKLKNYNVIFPFTVTFGGLTSLTELSLAENRLLELPPSFGALKSLRKLSAEGNWYTPQREE
jgi:Leucine-rich repeat (LRR) protein